MNFCFVVLVIVLLCDLIDYANGNDVMVVRSSTDDEHEPVTISQLADSQLNLHNKRMLIIGSFGYDFTLLHLLKLLY
jgi:hypothetical protein